MKYLIDLFSPETYQAFTNSNRAISGFRKRQENTAKKLKVGDLLICYVTKLSRFVGVLEITSKYFIDNTPIFYQENDPFIIRFKVKPLIWLPLEKSIPIFNKILWDNLSFIQNTKGWTGMVRNSLREFSVEDGEHIYKTLKEQNKNLTEYKFTEEDLKKIKSHTVKTQDSKIVTVSVPENDEKEEKEQVVSDFSNIRESIRMQALLAEIGERMNLKIWLPRSDRNRVLEIWKPSSKSLLESLPLNYDETTLKTIENIDVLWIKGRSIVRAFEVEHTTSIYSGILRMADLMALQPNLDIRAHIVAPDERKEKVLQEIIRPVFSLLEKGPLAESCTYISYDSIIELSKEKRLEYMNDGVVDEFTEEAEV